MTITGQLTARAPVSPHANLTATARIGATTWGSATWSVTCTCGATLEAYAPAIKSGKARCATCNPKGTAKHVAAIVAALPATYAKIERKTKLSYGKVRYGLEVARAQGLCHIGGWSRPDEQGAYSPIFHAGKGEDVPCTLQAIPRYKSEKRYKKRVKAAIAKAERGGPEDGRYIKHISLYLAKKTATKARATPNTWFAALVTL